MLYHLRNLRNERERGFTLIELLVVILIIGILSAIAIPAFMNQRKSAVDASLETDLVNNAKSIENWGLKQGVNTVPLPSELTADTINKNTTFPSGEITLSEGSQLAFMGDNTQYCIQGFNEGGNLTGDGEFLAYDSGAGGMLKESTTTVNCPATVLTQGLTPTIGSPGEVTPDFSGRTLYAPGLSFYWLLEKYPELQFDTSDVVPGGIQIRMDEQGRYELSSDQVWQHADMMIDPALRDIEAANGTVTFTWERFDDANTSAYISYGSDSFEIKDGKIVTKTGVVPAGFMAAWGIAPGTTRTDTDSFSNFNQNIHMTYTDKR